MQEKLYPPEVIRWQLVSKKTASKQLRARSEPHYVYVLLRGPNLPFYVGKGTKGNGVARVFQHEAEARGDGKSYKLNIIRALWKRNLSVLYAFDGFHDDEVNALARERVLIQTIGRHDLNRGPLANLTDGGEGTSNPSAESREARRQTLYGTDSESSDRAIANRFFQQLTSVKSVSLKPASEFKAKPLTPNRIPRAFSERQAATLAASAIKNRVLLKGGARIPRRLLGNGIELVIENGAGGDILKSGMATLTSDSVPGNETFLVGTKAIDYIVSIVGRGTLEAAGVLEPEI